MKGLLLTQAFVVAADLMTDLELTKDVNMLRSEDCPILNSLIEGAKIHSNNDLIASKITSAEESLNRCNWNG